jgi:hypothetical protein
METEHKAGPVPDLGMWELFVAQIQDRNEVDATVQDLIGEHPIFTCVKCSFATEVKGDVREGQATIFPKLGIVIRGDG